MNDKIIEMSNVYKTYKIGDVETHALENITLSIVEGEILVILGPSGSGKTTLLNVLSGLDSPTSGDIVFKGKNISKYNERKITKFRRDNLGFIFQTYNLLEHLNVKENIRVGSTLGHTKINIDEIIDVVGLSNHKNKYMYQLSGGEQQRVSIARALAKSPKVMFADEPTGALDEQTGKSVLKTLVDVNQKCATTMIIVTHNPGIALIGDRVIKMNTGKIQELHSNESRLDPDEIPWG